MTGQPASFIFKTIPSLRRAAPRLSREFFTCQPKHFPSRELSRSLSRSIRDRIWSSRWSTTSGETLKSPLEVFRGAVRQSSSISSSASIKKSSFFPETSSKGVAYWLLASATSVFGIVIFGGLTRLTESGLSITEWRPVTGSMPPMNLGDWESEFAKYRSSPEFQLLNPNMKMDEFKKIYYMEWIHRLWGRVVGLSFVIPAIYFVARRKVSGPVALRIGGIAGLIGFQGFLGWWMVKSGLKDDLFAPGSHPRVSQYRLTAHLGTAFLCYTAMLWNGLAILREHKYLKDPVTAQKLFQTLQSSQLKFFRQSVAGLALLAFCTALSGGLVAGLDAGLIYNDFPWMGQGLTPPKEELFSDFYSHRPDKSDTWWRNMLENPSLVQLDHRILATTTFTAIVGLMAYTRISPAVRRLLPAACLRGMHGVVGFACLQVTLGITTLLYLVPVHLASAHQAGALALLSWVFVLGGRTWIPARSSRLVAQKLAKMTTT